MAQAAWEKPTSTNPSPQDARAQLLNQGRNERWKYLVGGALLIGAILYLVLSGTVLGARYYITVDEVVGNPKYQDKPVRLNGVVLGETIDIDDTDPDNLIIRFTIANVPENYTNLAEALHIAAENPDATQLKVLVQGEPKPELLRHEAQAILTGTLGEDGVFNVTELNFKCPSRFEEGGPQVGSEQDHPGMLLDSEAQANAG